MSFARCLVKVLEAIAERREFIVAVKGMLLGLAVWVRFKDSRRNAGRYFRHDAANTFTRRFLLVLRESAPWVMH